MSPKTHQKRLKSPLFHPLSAEGRNWKLGYSGQHFVENKSHFNVTRPRNLYFNIGVGRQAYSTRDLKPKAAKAEREVRVRKWVAKKGTPPLGRDSSHRGG